MSVHTFHAGKHDKPKPYALTIVSSRLGAALIGPLTAPDEVVHKLVREANLTMMHAVRNKSRGPRPTKLPDEP